MHRQHMPMCAQERNPDLGIDGRVVPRLPDEADMTCTECGFDQSAHIGGHCPGGDAGDTFTEAEI